MLEFRKPLKPGQGVQVAYEQVRKLVPALADDRPPAPDIERLAQSVLAGQYEAALACRPACDGPLAYSVRTLSFRALRKIIPRH